MSILNIYQLVFVLTLASVVGLAYWSKVRFTAETRAEVKPRMQVAENPLRAAIAELDRLFDANAISVEEYVDRRGSLGTPRLT